jgi:hypothetical protein
MTFNCSAGPDTCTPASGDTNGSGTSCSTSTPEAIARPAWTSSSLGDRFRLVSASCTKNSLPIGTRGRAGDGIAVVPADVVNCTFYNTPAAYLTVNKACVPGSDPGLFNLRIDGVTQGANKPCGGTTGPILVTPTSHTVSETAGRARVWPTTTA